MTQPMLFEPAQHAPVFIPQTDDDGHEWGDFESCLAAFGTNACTLDDEPARIIGTPRTAHYAHIEPVDLEADPIRCCWDVVDIVMHDGGAFVRTDDDTDD
jgi:hypothetical protein